MIAAIDIGNTRTKVGFFSAGKLVRNLAIATGEDFSALGWEPLEGAVIGSVVPALSARWQDFLLPRARHVHLASAASPWGFRSEVEEPSRVGVDRLANIEAALGFPGAAIVVDAGTATKFDLLEGVEIRHFAGGAIAPGVEVSYRALLAGTAQLGAVDLAKHSPVIGYNTETAIRSGVVHGFAAQVDGMIVKIFEERELPPTTVVVATGGAAGYLKGRARLITHYRPHLTLEGLHALAEKVFPRSSGPERRDL